MEKQQVTYTFENPNRDEVFEREFLQILVEKLTAQRQDMIQTTGGAH